MKKLSLLIIVCLFLAACQPNTAALPNPKQGSDLVTAGSKDQTATPAVDQPPTPAPYTNLPAATTTAPSPAATPAVPADTAAAGSQNNAAGKVPNFDHIVLIVLENKGYDQVIGSPQAPNLNALAKKYVQLSNYYAVSHPSLPNYIALMSGGTQDITSDCNSCFVNQKNLADLIGASGRTWKAYEEDMPSPCSLGDTKLYAQKHNPLIYFDSVRLNTSLCDNSIVPLTQLDSDLAANQLPNFSFLMPNLCNSGHDCAINKPDAWVQNMVTKLQASPALGNNSLIMVVFDEAEGSNKGSCCGLGTSAGGQVAAILISPLAKPGFTDSTEYSHYSLLKTILTAWDLPGLGMTQDPATSTILAPWIQK
jgi:phosphatidylinositol-3-phosphatase